MDQSTTPQLTPPDSHEVLIPHKRSGIVILLFLATLFATSLAVYFYLQYLKILSEVEGLKSQLTQTTPPRLAEVTDAGGSPTITPDPTANWKMYSMPTLNLQFKLPPQLTTNINWTEKIIKGEIGSAIYFQETQTPRQNGFLIGGISTNYQAGRESSFYDTNGFDIKNGQTFYKSPNNRTSLIPSQASSTITNVNGIPIVKIRGMKLAEDESGQSWALLGNLFPGTFGALINTPNPTYPGLAISIQTNPELTETVFDQILSTFKFLD